METTEQMVIESQCRLIARHLNNGYTINQEQARRLYGCWRLAARMNDLRNGRFGIAPVKWECKMIYNGRSKYGEYEISLIKA